MKTPRYRSEHFSPPSFCERKKLSMTVPASADLFACDIFLSVERVVQLTHSFSFFSKFGAKTHGRQPSPLMKRPPSLHAAGYVDAVGRRSEIDALFVRELICVVAAEHQDPCGVNKGALE